MLALEVTMNVFVLFGLLLATSVIGFLLRSAQVRSLKSKVIELEREMLNNHASILELQKERAFLEKQIRESKIPVIAMKKSKEEIEHENKKLGLH